MSTEVSGIAEGAEVTIAVRPEDVVPHNLADAGEDIVNLLPATITDMEFLGSFWRSHLRSPVLGDAPLIANFSVNAVRRLDLEHGTELAVELPAERVLVFPRGE